MRGLPGSGKSHRARRLMARPWQIASADDFFVRHGRYEWRGSGLAQAHAWCQGVAEGLLRAGCDVVVDNTNILARHVAHYIGLAGRHGAQVRIAYSDAPWAWDPAECHRRNTHGVPLEAIESMAAKFEPFSLGL